MTHRLWPGSLLAFAMLASFSDSASGQPAVLPPSMPDGNQSEVASDEIQRMWNCWSDRSQSPDNGQMVFQLVRRTRSPDYGAMPTLDTNALEESPNTVRVRFDASSIRLDGKAVPALRIGRTILPDTEVWKATDEFVDTLYRGQKLLDPGTGVPCDWSVMVDRDTETHSWVNENAVPCMVRFSSGTAGPLILHDSGKYGSLPAIWALVEAMRVSIRPQWVMTKRQRASATLQNDAIIDGKQCSSIQFSMPQLTGEVSCEVRVNAFQGNSVVGATFTDTNHTMLARYDIDYDSDVHGCWWPKRISVVQFNGFGDPYESMEIQRQSCSSSEIPEGRQAAVNPSPGAYVIDRTTGEQYRMAVDGSRHRLALTEAVSLVFPKDDLRGSADSESGGRALLLKMIFTLISWPWILVVVPAAAFCWQMLRVRTVKRA